MASTPSIPGPPYPPTTASLGLQPTIIPDDPICGVLILLFLGSAATHMTIFQLNRRREHKFLFSAMCFGFSMARVVALSMRIVWASFPTNINIAIASSIFTAAGVLVLFLMNLFFAMRILRGYHPGFGWHPTVDLVFKVLLFCVPALLAMVIVAVVYSFFTLDAAARLKCHDVQLVALTFLAALACLPIPIVSAAALWPRRDKSRGRVEKFGSGRWRTKVRLVLFTSTLLGFGATYRAGTAYILRPVSDPAGFQSKEAFYCVNFAIELVVVYTYAVVRFDRRFHVPNGSSSPGDYAGVMVNTEEEVFGPAAFLSPVFEGGDTSAEERTVVGERSTMEMDRVPRLKW